MWFGKKSSVKDRRILLMSKALNCATLWTMFKTGVNHKQDVTHWDFVASAPEADASSSKKASSHVGERNFSRVLEQKMGCLLSARATWGCPYQQTISTHQTRNRTSRQGSEAQLQKLSAQAVILSIMSLTLAKCSSQRNCYTNFNSLIPSVFLTFK